MLAISPCCSVVCPFSARLKVCTLSKHRPKLHGDARPIHELIAKLECVRREPYQSFP